MVHAIGFRGRRRPSYRNRFVRTAGLAAEQDAGAPLWAGIIEPPGDVAARPAGARTAA